MAAVIPLLVNPAQIASFDFDNRILYFVDGEEVSGLSLPVATAIQSTLRKTGFVAIPKTDPVDDSSVAEDPVETGDVPVDGVTPTEPAETVEAENPGTDSTSSTDANTGDGK